MEETLRREFAIALGLCTNCQAKLPQDHGFDELCDTCKTIEPISGIGSTKPTAKEPVDLRIVEGVAIARPRKKKRLENGSIRRRSLTRILDKMDSEEEPKESISQKEFSEIIADIDFENSTFEEISVIKQQCDDELAKVKYELIQVSKGSAIWKELESRRTALGLKCQKLQVLRKQKKISENKIVKSNNDTINDERSNHFMHTFFHIAKRLLSKEICDMIERQARVESGQE